MWEERFYHTWSCISRKFQRCRIWKSSNSLILQAFVKCWGQQKDHCSRAIFGKFNKTHSKANGAKNCGVWTMEIIQGSFRFLFLLFQNFKGSHQHQILGVAFLKIFSIFGHSFWGMCRCLTNIFFVSYILICHWCLIELYC